MSEARRWPSASTTPSQGPAVPPSPTVKWEASSAATCGRPLQLSLLQTTRPRTPHCSAVTLNKGPHLPSYRTNKEGIKNKTNPPGSFGHSTYRQEASCIPAMASLLPPPRGSDLSQQPECSGQGADRSKGCVRVTEQRRSGWTERVAWGQGVRDSALVWSSIHQSAKALGTGGGRHLVYTPDGRSGHTVEARLQRDKGRGGRWRERPVWSGGRARALAKVTAPVTYHSHSHGRPVLARVASWGFSPAGTRKSLFR